MLEPGMRVRIKDAETLMADFGVTKGAEIRKGSMFVPGMWQCCGREVTITKTTPLKTYSTYRLQFDEEEFVNIYGWNEYMFAEQNKQEYAPINIEDIL